MPRDGLALPEALSPALTEKEAIYSSLKMHNCQDSGQSPVFCQKSSSTCFCLCPSVCFSLGAPGAAGGREPAPQAEGSHLASFVLVTGQSFLPRAGSLRAPGGEDVAVWVLGLWASSGMPLPLKARVVQVAGAVFCGSPAPVYCSQNNGSQPFANITLLKNQKERNQAAWLPCVLVLFQVLRRPL